VTATDARTAADLASLLPIDHPLAQVARLRLDAHVRSERNQMKIRTPRTDFNGVSCGVQFVDGVATTADPAAIGYFQSAGYEVDGETLNPRSRVEDPVDPRTIDGSRRIGAPLLDAAAAPRKDRR
jgi:hypothetical protein